MAEKTPVTVNRNERVIAYMIASTIGLSVLGILSVIAATGFGVRNFGEGLWPLVVILPAIGLPIGFVLIIVLLVLSGVRRGRAARDDSK